MYTDEFRTQVVEAVRGGMTQTKASKEFKVSANTISKWLKPAKKTRKPAKARDAENYADDADFEMHLARRIAELERTVLNMTAALFKDRCEH